MLILIALVYFILACSVIWVALFPAGRQLAGQVVGALGRWRLPRPRMARGDGLRRWWRGNCRFVAAHRLPLALAAVLVRPMLVDASRNWQLLSPDFSQRLLMAFKIMKEKHGYEMALLEGYRSPARQNLLASMGSSVTNAGAFQSWHQYGLAADCAFWRDGKLVISEKDPWAMRGYQLYGEVAESLGLTWGGRWTMTDFGHTELRVKGVMHR